ncbi:hypothetical protein VTK73DRAFT_9072 [Phialemonium thermophilum]|uniref:Uncharacterized protein n=1 Tax=Phialemonium thermophilum TaxID=223376 RepID=A0ABR3W523_9PEZI
MELRMLILLLGIKKEPVARCEHMSLSPASSPRPPLCQTGMKREKTTDGMPRISLPATGAGDAFARPSPWPPQISKQGVVSQHLCMGNAKEPSASSIPWRNSLATRMPFHREPSHRRSAHLSAPSPASDPFPTLPVGPRLHSRTSKETV